MEDDLRFSPYDHAVCAVLLHPILHAFFTSLSCSAGMACTSSPTLNRSDESRSPHLPNRKGKAVSLTTEDDLRWKFFTGTLTLWTSLSILA